MDGNDDGHHHEGGGGGGGGPGGKKRPNDNAGDYSSPQKKPNFFNGKFLRCIDERFTLLL